MVRYLVRGVGYAVDEAGGEMLRGASIVTQIDSGSYGIPLLKRTSSHNGGTKKRKESIHDECSKRQE
jgi:hypothetical protein